MLAQSNAIVHSICFGAFVCAIVFDMRGDARPLLLFSM